MTNEMEPNASRGWARALLILRILSGLIFLGFGLVGGYVSKPWQGIRPATGFYAMLLVAGILTLLESAAEATWFRPWRLVMLLLELSLILLLVAMWFLSFATVGV